MLAVVFLPIQKLFDCNYLKVVESEIHNLTYNEAKPNFFFDYYNLNPIEDFENQKQTLNSQNPFKINVKSDGKHIDMLEYQRNQLVSGNIFLKAM